jgi:hypothetical protein
VAVISRGKTEQQAARTARLSAALRENLKRRKAQARGRAEADAPDDADHGKPAAERSSGPQAPDFRRNRGRD